METPHTVICAAGEQTRWDNFMDGPKYLAPVELNQPLICRTVNQLRKLGIVDIELISADERCNCEGSTTVSPRKSWLDRTCIGQAMPHLQQGRRNIVLMGDVWWTVTAIGAVVSNDSEQTVFFGRSKSFESHGPEIFAVTIPWTEYARWGHAILEVGKVRDSLGMSGAGGWLVYRLLNGIELTSNEIRGNFVELNDHTQDWDYPSEYLSWRQRMFNERIVYDRKGT